MPDADKPIARLEIDTRAYGPLICEHCDQENEEEGEREAALLMEDGAVVCDRCLTPFEVFEQFSGVIASVSQVKAKDLGREGFEVIEDE